MNLLLPLVPLLPLLMLLALAWPVTRGRVMGALWLAPLPALLIAPLALGSSLVFYPGGVRFTLLLDAPGALLLGGAALLWSAAGVFARAQMGKGPMAKRFAAWWLLTLAGCLGVFIAGDLLSFYLAFAVVSLAAFGLVAHDGTEKARRAGGLYLLLAVIGEIALLLAFALLHGRAGTESIAIADVAPVLRTTPGGPVIAMLLILGFGLKMGLMPLHVWLPIAHPAAPAPGSAVLSGAIIKAGVIGLVRFLPFDGAPAPDGALLTALGFATAYWGVAMGLTQRNPKTILAYSSVSQMGVVAATLGMGLTLGLAETPIHAAFYALHHMLAKGALFLGVGLALATGPGGRALVLPLALLLALGFGGLPPTGGALAKAAVKPELGEGLAAAAAMLSAFGSTALMLHFVHQLRAAMLEAPTAKLHWGLGGPWLILGLAALVLPWSLYGAVTGKAPEGLWSAASIAPILAGAAFALLWARIFPRVPEVPAGDLLVFAERGSPMRDAMARFVVMVEHATRPWPIAGIALMLIILALYGLIGLRG
ncbi:MAG: complex I subunit 5 family protein [Alphaproteobacteria bacterium]|jgi:formate hydrogenlyase subunit 3/multisubunit Na+/H+ antiporter MnhD subunit